MRGITMNAIARNQAINYPLLTLALVGTLACLTAVARDVNEPDESPRRRVERPQAPAAAPAPPAAQSAPSPRMTPRSAPINPTDGSPPRNGGATWQRGENRSSGNPDTRSDNGNSNGRGTVTPRDPSVSRDAGRTYSGPGQWSTSDRYSGSYRNDRQRPLYGSTIRVLPRGFTRYGYQNDYYYFNDGLWYRPFGGYYTIARPPRGLMIYTLPPYYTSLWYAGDRYYYADDVYYRRDSGNRGYVVSDPPVEDNPVTDELYVYPTRGQGTEQQAKDRFECYRWAADQTGFDPTQPEAGVRDGDSVSQRADYRRAETACLEGRGYSVK
jgi:hypothetical protein